MDSSVRPNTVDGVRGAMGPAGTLAHLAPDGSAVVLCDDGTRRSTPAGSLPPGRQLRVGQRIRVLADGGRTRVELWEPAPGVHPASGS